jgi:hypothetical protein
MNRQSIVKILGDKLRRSRRGAARCARQRNPHRNLIHNIAANLSRSLGGRSFSSDIDPPQKSRASAPEETLQRRPD